MELTIKRHGEQYLQVQFRYRAEYVEKIRLVDGRRWNKDDKIWIIPYTLSVVEQFNYLFSNCPVKVESDLWEECEPLQRWMKAVAKQHTSPSHSTDSNVRDQRRERFQHHEEPIPDLTAAAHLDWDSREEQKLKHELKARGYSPKTMKAYCGQTERFFRYLQTHSLPLSDRALQTYPKKNTSFRMFCLKVKCYNFWVLFRTLNTKPFSS